MKYDEYVTEMKEAIERSHKRHAKVKTKKNQQNQAHAGSQPPQPVIQQQTSTVLHSPLGTNNNAGPICADFVKMESLD